MLTASKHACTVAAEEHCLLFFPHCAVFGDDSGVEGVGGVQLCVVAKESTVNSALFVA